ncbi:hypothetical protein [Bombilactobacillus bombi]|uniref:hypothetical protein n=1 Tax=Bombilactobacillus bombi TaxID=1303590 RepID=UPI0015E5E408|nr:hypothetical protein [Bombilactobacillus bombi]MBA1433672.1 hypothetical protein [Bombilactobacillus bombi]
MADLFDGNRSITLDVEYKVDYQTLQKANLSTADIFFLTMIIGCRQNQKITPSTPAGPKFNTLEFSPVQKDLVYGIILNQDDMDLDKLANDEIIAQIWRTFISYAQGGMQWLRSHTFADNLNEQGAIELEPELVLLKLNEFLQTENDDKIAPF